MEKLKKQKIQEILDQQNAVIDADMVCVGCFSFYTLYFIDIMPIKLYFNLMQNNKGKGRLKYLLQQTELFAHFAKGDQSSSQKKSRGRYDQLNSI